MRPETKFIAIRKELMLALLLDTSNLRVLVFGYGTVGRRKSQYFEGHVKSVTAAGPESTADEQIMKSLIDRHDIIIAATDSPACNDRILQYAKSTGKWCNSATGTGSSFYIPASFTEGEVTVAVSTNGTAPAFASYLRDDIRTSYPELAESAALQNRLRADLKTRIPDRKTRGELLRAAAADSEIRDALKKGNVSEAEKIAWTKYR